jgi:hypothetical protein
MPDIDGAVSVFRYASPGPSPKRHSDRQTKAAERISARTFIVSPQRRARDGHLYRARISSLKKHRARERRGYRELQNGTPVAEQSRQECLVQDISLVLTGQKAQGSCAIGPWAPSTKVGKKTSRLECPIAFRRLQWTGSSIDRILNGTAGLPTKRQTPPSGYGSLNCWPKREFKVRDVMARRGMACVKPFEPDREEQRGAD